MWVLYGLLAVIMALAAVIGAPEIRNKTCLALPFLFFNAACQLWNRNGHRIDKNAFLGERNKKWKKLEKTGYSFSSEEYA